MTAMEILEAIDQKDIYNLIVKSVKEYDGKYGKCHIVICDEDPKRDHFGKPAEEIKSIIFFVGDTSKISVPSVGDVLNVYGYADGLKSVEELYTCKNGSKHIVIRYDLYLKNVMSVADAQAEDDDRTEKSKHVLSGKVEGVQFNVKKIGENKYGKMYAILVDSYGIEYYHPYTNIDAAANIDEGDDVYLKGYVETKNGINRLVALGDLSHTSSGTVVENRIDLNQ